MIKLPKFNEQSMFDYETFNSLTTNEERIGKFLAHYEAMKLAVNIPGEIVECGVFKGTSLMRFALMRQIMGGQNSARIFGFYLNVSKQFTLLVVSKATNLELMVEPQVLLIWLNLD